MSHHASTFESPPFSGFTLNVSSLDLSDEQFEQICRDNRELRIELTSKGDLIIMPPSGSMTGWRNSKINQRLANWAELDFSGITFDSSSGFTLPDGSKRSPDAAWIRRERWESLTTKERERFAPIVPDFVIELSSPADDWRLLEEKMRDYVRNGVRLGWLIDPQRRRVLVYSPDHPVKVLEQPLALAGEPVLSGFVFDVSEIW